MRVSYGLTGNNRIGDYDYMARLYASENTYKYPWDSTFYPGYYVSSIANPNLKWETTEQYDFGLDVYKRQQEITLNANQTMFSIEFATSNYVAANKNEIIYKLEGFSEDWNSTRGQPIITYTNLNAGTYNLLIKPKGKEESICPQVHLTIHVLPPYYKTPLAYLIYLIVTGILLWYLVKTYKSRIKLRESLKYEQKLSLIHI